MADSESIKMPELPPEHLRILTYLANFLKGQRDSHLTESIGSCAETAAANPFALLHAISTHVQTSPGPAGPPHIGAAVGAAAAGRRAAPGRGPAHARLQVVGGVPGPGPRPGHRR